MAVSSPLFSSLCALALAVTFTMQAGADDVAARYQNCLDRTQQDAEAAMEDALVWSSQGGGLRAQHCLGLAYVQQGKFRLGALKLQDSAGVYSNRAPQERAELLVQAGEAWLAGGYRLEAVTAFDAAIEMVPGLFEAYVGRGNARVADSDHGRAVQDYSMATALEPNDNDVMAKLARSFLALGDLSAADEVITRSLAIDPAHIETLLVRATLRQQREGITLPGEED